MPRLRRITGYVELVQYLPESDSQVMFVGRYLSTCVDLGDIGICFKGYGFSASCVCGGSLSESIRRYEGRVEYSTRGTLHSSLLAQLCRVLKWGYSKDNIT